MHTYLFFDTETTGLPNWDIPLDDPSQPHITQLAAILTDEDGGELDSMNVFIQPDGWVVPDETYQLNGISTEFLQEHGIPMLEALERFNGMKARCTHRVGHNISFDKTMLKREAEGLKVAHDSEGLQQFCTMQGTKNIVGARSANGRIKSPKLIEACEFFGVPHGGQHDAMEDVRACMGVFFALKKWQAASTAAENHTNDGQ